MERLKIGILDAVVSDLFGCIHVTMSLFAMLFVEIRSNSKFVLLGKSGCPVFQSKLAVRLPFYPL